MLQLKAGEHDDIQQIREEAFGKACFTSKTQTDRFPLLGTITQSIPTEKGGYSRKKYWVYAKPSRQVGARPKVRKTLTLDADLCDQLTAKAKEGQCTEVSIVEAALHKYFEAEEHV